MVTTNYAESVAQHVAQRIADANETSLGVAEKTGIPRTTLMRRLAGVSPFTVTELALIAELLGLEVRDLVDASSTAEKASA